MFLATMDQNTVILWDLGCCRPFEVYFIWHMQHVEECHYVSCNVWSVQASLMIPPYIFPTLPRFKGICSIDLYFYGWNFEFLPKFCHIYLVLYPVSNYWTYRFVCNDFNSFGLFSYRDSIEKQENWNLLFLVPMQNTGSSFGIHLTRWTPESSSR